MKDVYLGINRVTLAERTMDEMCVLGWIEENSSDIHGSFSEFLEYIDNAELVVGNQIRNKFVELVTAEFDRCNEPERPDDVWFNWTEFK